MLGYCVEHSLRARGDVELVVDTTQMPFHGANTHVQFGRDVLIPETFRGIFQHLPLTRTKLCREIVSGRNPVTCPEMGYLYCNGSIEDRLTQVNSPALPLPTHLPGWSSRDSQRHRPPSEQECSRRHRRQSTSVPSYRESAPLSDERRQFH